MRNWIGIILLLFVCVAGADTEPRVALVQIGPDDFTTKTLGQETVEGHAYLIVQAEARNAQVASTFGPGMTCRTESPVRSCYSIITT